jgi:3-hydroxybutyrate dehydrogenase
LAKAGADVVLNSFTDREEDHALAAEIAEGDGRDRALHQGGHVEGRRMPRADRKGRRLRYPRQQRRHPACGPIPDFPTEKWDAIIAINLSSAFHTTAAALPLMRAAGWGGDQHRLGPRPDRSPYKSAYIAAKHGIVGLTKTTALETAEEPITANAICPGYVLTPLVEAQIPDTMKEYDMSREDVIRKVMLTRQPSKEFATVEQMGGTAAFLCSDAAAQITGTTISVDGGWTAL